LISIGFFTFLWGFDGAMVSQVCGLFLIDELFPKLVVLLFGVFEESATRNNANNLPKGSIAHETLHVGGPVERELSFAGYFFVRNVTKEEEHLVAKERKHGPTKTYTFRDAFFGKTLRGVETRSDLEHRH